MVSTADSHSHLIQAADVGKTFPGGHSVLAGLSLSIREGEFVSLVGPSGCGKSTLLKLLAGFDDATSGTLTIAEQPPDIARKTSHRVGFVFQDANLLPWRTVRGNLQLPMELQQVSSENRPAHIDEMLELIGLTAADANKYPRMLSGGMRMRVSLGRALMTQPQILLLDEPFGALDDILRQQLNEELSRIWQEQNWTGLFVTHNVSEAVFLSQRILVMSTAPGKIVAEIPVPFPFPRTPELRADSDFARLTGEVTTRLRGRL
ncbi:MAG: ABC transporter ATP-binding protein [Planctomycetota bacterium]|nr:ABC transporter ATP-binding protein [Planctomycetota bacterium]